MPNLLPVLFAALTLLSACSSVPKPPVAVEDTTSPRWKISESPALEKADKVRIDISLASSTVSGRSAASGRRSTFTMENIRRRRC